MQAFSLETSSSTVLYIQSYKHIVLWFQLKEDTTNWEYARTMGSKFILKKDVCPHINLKRHWSDNVSSQVHDQPTMKRPKPNENITPSASRIVLSDITSIENIEKRDSTSSSPSSSQASTLSDSPKNNLNKENSDYIPSQSSSDPDSENIEGQQRQRLSIALIEKKSRFYLGLPENVYHIVKFITEIEKIKYMDVLISLKKIRVGDPYSRLADDFDLSISSVHKIFTKAVPMMANCLQELIYWPDISEIKRNLPIPFRARYKKVISIIDCLEIEIEKPSDPVRQCMTWSEYKKCNTVKFLISATPNGAINFVSGAYGGRASDQEIFEASKYVDKLPNEMSIMADRGFKHIEPLLRRKKCSLVRPPSVPNNQNLSREIVIESKRIASLRIHVERVIKRIREFTLLDIHSRINTNLLYLINHIIIIACGICNVQGPLMK